MSTLLSAWDGLGQFKASPFPPDYPDNVKQVVIGRSIHGAINHDKLIVINRILTICGSTNFSVGGETKQNNEATIVYDRAFAAETVNRIEIIHSEMAAQMGVAP